MKKNQLITMVSALALVGALGIGSTLAFLQAQSEAVVNTFTVGSDLDNGDILLDEAKLADKSTPADPADRVQENTYDKLQAGDSLYKDPTVHVAANTADCYLFVEVKGLDNLAANAITVVDWNANWVKVDASEGLDGVYYYKNDAGNVVAELGTVQDFIVFDGLKVADDADFYANGEKAQLENVVVKACAVQAQNVPFDKAAGLGEYAGKPMYTFVSTTPEA